MSVNKIILLGFVGKDPEIKNFDNGSKVTFSLATTERGYTAKNGTVVPDRVDWFNIVAFGGLANIVESYVKKGTQLYIEGKVRTRSYEKDGQKHYVTEVYANEIELLGKSSTQERSSVTEPINEPNDDIDN